MLLHVDHLVPGMILEKDIELKAGSYLITCNELNNGKLVEKNIDGIKKFSSQIVPIQNRVHILSDEFALGCIKSVVRKDLHRIADAVTSGKDYPNYLEDFQLQARAFCRQQVLLDVLIIALHTKRSDDLFCHFGKRIKQDALFIFGFVQNMRSSPE